MWDDKKDDILEDIVTMKKKLGEDTGYLKSNQVYFCNADNLVSDGIRIMGQDPQKGDIWFSLDNGQTKLFDGDGWREFVEEPKLDNGSTKRD